MKLYTTLIAIVSMLSLQLNANAMVFGGSNLGYSGYPDCDCTKPYKPYSFSSQWEIDSYRSEMNEYINCVNEYVENANNDIQRIKENAQEAINEAENGF